MADAALALAAPAVAVPTKDPALDRDVEEVTKKFTLAAPPLACPDVYKAKVETLDDNLQRVLVQYNVHWLVQFNLANLDYNLCRELAGRFSSDSDWESFSIDFGVFPGQNGFKKDSSRLARIRMESAVDQCKFDKKRKIEEHSSTGLEDFKAMLGRGDREEMQVAFKVLNNNQEPSADFEGSDHYLAILKKAFMRGEFPSGATLDSKSIVAQHTLQGEVKFQESKESKEGTQFVKEEASEAWGKEAWRRRMNIWRTSMLMASAVAVNHPRLQITTKDLDLFYDFLEGDKIMTSAFHPALATVKEAERGAWRKISLALRKDPNLTLKQAIKDMIGGDWKVLLG